MMTHTKSGTEHPIGVGERPASRRADPSRLTPQILSPVPDAALDSGPRAALAWQLWLDGEIRRTPLPLADGVLVLLDRPTGTVAVRLDEDGRELWAIELPGIASGDPVRTHGFVAVPIDGERITVIDVNQRKLQRHGVRVPGAVVRGGIAALGGRLWIRFSETSDGLGPFLAVFDVHAPDEAPRLHPDPLGVAIETRCRRTNNTVVAAAEHPGGHAIVVGLDETTARVLWRHELPETGVVDLWAAGGLVDLVVSDGLQSWDARSGQRLTRRFGGRALEGSRLAGETLLVLAPHDDGDARQLLAFNACTEELTGTHAAVQRILGANSDLALARDHGGLPRLFDLPQLLPLTLREADALEGCELVAFSRHALWVVAHGGRSLSCLEPPND